MKFNDDGNGYAVPMHNEKVCSKHFIRIDLEEPVPSKYIPKPCSTRRMMPNVSLLKKNHTVSRPVYQSEYFLVHNSPTFNICVHIIIYLFQLMFRPLVAI